MKMELIGTGTAALLMHNGRLSDPLDPASKAVHAIAAKRQKTDEDQLALADLEWSAGLYWDDVAGPYIPGENIWRAIFDAAGQQKMRPRVKAGLRVIDAINPLVYHGSRIESELREDENYRLRRSVRNQMARVIRTRPMFREWGFTTTLLVDDSKLNPADVERMCKVAGDQMGLGDWRPMYGTFATQLRRIA